MTKAQLKQKIEDLETERKTFNGALKAYEDRVEETISANRKLHAKLGDVREDNAILIMMTGNLSLELEKLKAKL